MRIAPMSIILAAAAPVLLLSACGGEDTRPAYGEISPPLLYAPDPPPAYVPRPGYVAPPQGAPFAVVGETSPAYLGPGEHRPPPPGGSCIQPESGLGCADRP